MEGKVFRLVLCTVLLLAFGASAFATDVVGPGASPAQIVRARKLAMASNGGLAGDIQAKLTAGNVKAVAADARAIAAIATLVPLIFTAAYSDVYPVPGSKFFFKGGPADDFAAAAGGLNAAAEDLASAAGTGDKAATSAAFGKLGAACGACHSVFRGQY
jgi:cytochrome c556